MNLPTSRQLLPRSGVGVIVCRLPPLIFCAFGPLCQCHNGLGQHMVAAESLQRASESGCLQPLPFSFSIFQNQPQRKDRSQRAFVVRPNDELPRARVLSFLQASSKSASFKKRSWRRLSTPGMIRGNTQSSKQRASREGKRLDVQPSKGRCTSHEGVFDVVPICPDVGGENGHSRCSG